MNNKSYTKFNQEEEKLLNLGIIYAIEKPISHNIRQLIIETEHAIN
jgi:hypothetical protein